MDIVYVAVLYEVEVIANCQMDSIWQHENITLLVKLVRKKDWLALAAREPGSHGMIYRGTPK